MKIKQAIAIVEAHNKWRRGHLAEYPHSPEELGKALDVLIKFAKEKNK